MDAAKRKERTENRLKEWNIPVYSNLPVMEEEEVVKLKTAQEVAKRILILTYLNCATQVEDKQEIVLFLNKEGLWDSATEEEKQLFEKQVFTEEEITSILWSSEAILLLLWSIHKVETLEVPIEEADMAEIIPLLPPFFSSTHHFVESAAIRPVSDIMDQADLTFRLHWALRQAEVEGSEPLALDPGIVYERHYALDWLICLTESMEENV